LGLTYGLHCDGLPPVRLSRPPIGADLLPGRGRPLPGPRIIVIESRARAPNRMACPCNVFRPRGKFSAANAVYVRRLTRPA